MRYYWYNTFFFEYELFDVFSWCVARVPVSLWKLKVCSLDVAQLFATVRNRSQPSATVCVRAVWPCLCEFCNSGHFWRFQTSRCLVLRGRRSTLWPSNMFHNVSKVVLCGRRNTFATFSEVIQFSRQAQHFRRVMLPFFANRIVWAGSSGDKVQIAWQAWRFVRC